MMDFDKHIEQVLKSDNIGFEPDPVIKIRLLNYLKIHSIGSFVRRNAIVPAIRIRSQTWKYGIAAAFFMLVLFGTKMKNESSLYVQNDTLTNSQFVDSICLDSIGTLAQ